jgi:hypothetical protein
MCTGCHDEVCPLPPSAGAGEATDRLSRGWACAAGRPAPRAPVWCAVAGRRIETTRAYVKWADEGLRRTVDGW